MSPEFEKKLIEKYPTFFIRGQTPRDPYFWGLEVEDGWYGILEEACEEISKLDNGTFRFTQIKEKWGQLRSYFDYIGDEIDNTNELFQIIDDLEDTSRNVCEFCGSMEGVTTSGSWLKTVCKNCRNI